MELSEFVEKLKRECKDEIVHVEIIPERKPQTSSLKRPLPDELKDYLLKAGIKNFYLHQAKAIDLIREGKNVVIASGTASGKSLCYNVPVLESIFKNRKTRALYLFPTKALAQDQLKKLNELGISFLKAGTYDGDTSMEERRWARSYASIVLSNPEMLHLGVLSYHKTWGDFLLNLKYVVIDEIHILRGVFGSNVANVIRRLRRICGHYRSYPQFILASATIANPKELAENLCGLKFELVKEDTSPQGRKFFLFLNPSFLDKTKLRRKSSHSKAAELFARLVKENIRTIVFSPSRKTAELVLRFARKNLEKKKVASQITSYRAGYLPSERREIEKKLFSGKLLGVSSTSALELGVDIGKLDACVINGFPSSVTSCFQQAGRAGRRKKDSLAVLVAQDDPLNQYYMNHPQDFFGKPFEEAIISFENPTLFRKHLSCAAYELPLREEDKKYFGESFGEVVEQLLREKDIARRGDKWFWIKKEFPAKNVNLRAASFNDYSIVDAETGSLIGTVDESMAFFYIHPGAIYLHQGESYFIEELKLDERIALARLFDGDYYTQPRDRTDITIIETKLSKKVGKTKVCWGKVEVSVEVFAYDRRKIFTGEILATEELSLPLREFETEAYWFILPEDLKEKLGLSSYEFAGGIHGLEHGLIALLPLFALCDRQDIGGVSTEAHFQTGLPTIFIYDGYEGGVGISKRGYELCKAHFKKTFEGIRDCPCKDGCPSCIQSPKCGNYNEPLDKEAALKILGEILK